MIFDILFTSEQILAFKLKQIKFWLYFLEDISFNEQLSHLISSNRIASFTNQISCTKKYIKFV